MEEPIANSSMLVLPRIGRPAARSRATTVASYGGTQPSRIREPHVVGSPSVASTSLTAIGTPSSEEAGRPAARRSSAALGSGERPLGVDVQEGVHGAVDGGDPVQVGLGQLDRGGLAGGQRVGELGGGAAGQVIVHE